MHGDVGEWMASLASDVSVLPSSSSMRLINKWGGLSVILFEALDSILPPAMIRFCLFS